MKMYKTSYFKEIKEIEVESFTEDTFEIKMSIYRPLDKRYLKDDKVRMFKRYDSQNAYHETMLEAKNYVLMQLSDKITQMELDLKKYKNLVPNFQ